MKKRVFQFTLLGLSLLFCLFVAEVVSRSVLREALQLVQDERNLAYRYDDELGWFPVKNGKTIFQGSQFIHVEHNERGFRDPEHVIEDKPRLMVLGDSFVWGYDVEEEDRFTEVLRKKLPGWSIYNLGVSGYGTDQEYLLLQSQVGFYDPDLVVLLFTTMNDPLDNMTNFNFGAYYKPYYVVEEGIRLEAKGAPVPRSSTYFFSSHPSLARSYLIRLLMRNYFNLTTPAVLQLDDPTQAIIIAMNERVREEGAVFVVGLEDDYPQLERFLAASKIPFVSLANPHRFPRHSQHWNPEGHSFAGEKLYEFMRDGGYLEVE